jgi:two-component sensor histidine kinase
VLNSPSAKPRELSQPVRTAILHAFDWQGRTTIRPFAQTLAALGAAGLIASAALIFDAVTPQMLEVGLFYVAIVLTGFWFPKPKAVLVLALFATFLIIIGYWVTIPDDAPAWAAWANRALAIGTVWLTAAFVWYIRILQQKLQVQIDIANGLSREMAHRVGNSLQLVASFLRLQAVGTSSESSRHVLEIAGSRIMVIGHIERLLSHFGATDTVDSKVFISALLRDVHSILPNPDQIRIDVQVDSTQISSTAAIALGALLVELINNALKHAFREGMEGKLAVRFTTSKSMDQCLVEVEDDGIGIGQGQKPDGVGVQNVTEFARMVGGSLTCQPARQANPRPGTMWRLTFSHAALH